MPTTFNTLLDEAGLDPGDVRLLRHADPTSAPGRTPFHLWHGNRAKFDRYQSSQHMDERTRSKLKSKYWASFVGTPKGETLFVGVYGVRYLGLLPKDEPAPHHDGIDKAGTLDEYELVLDERLRDRIGQLYVDWGGGKKSWIQRADLQDKAVYEGSRGGIRSDSIVEGLLHEIETNGDLPKKANAESGWFAVVPRKWQDLMDRAAREGRDGPNLIVYRTTTNDPRDHHVIPFMVTRELLTDATAPIRADGSRRWEMTLKADQLRVTHGERVVDVSGYRGAALPGEVVGAAGDVTRSGTGGGLPARSVPGAGPASPASFVARICWNSQGWTHPTGEAARLEAKGSYVADRGFGHEEWLFDGGAALDGWQYVYLQAVNKSYRKVVGRTIDLRLWTMGPGSTRYYVGRLPACEVVTPDGAETAVKQFVASGRLAQMESQVRAVNGKPDDLRAGPLNVVNLRFRLDSAAIHDPLIPAADGHAIRELKRYMLVGDGDRWRRALLEWPAAGRRPALPVSPTYPDGMHLPVTGQEGERRTEVVNVYERDSTLRDACLKHYGPACVVCGMTFEALYGAEFAGMSCHVHHLTMISAFGGSREVHPIRDLRPVCPNCHAAIHRRRDVPYTPEEIQERLRRAPRPVP